MTTNNFKTAKQVANELNKIATAYGIVYETVLIENDMAYYAKETIEWADAMKAEKSFYNYSRNLYIRHHGVESSLDRANHFGGIVAKVTIKFDKTAKEYTVIRENI